ncbi:hypothetical protein ACLQ3K_24900 [Tsukamurella sp. DT100]|uniref:hypothetical protein n=1 Tax=Tsukamurella sp. DT100 TaxID=3393415 RepID=UPI003CEAC329
MVTVRPHLYPQIDTRWEPAIAAAYEALESGADPSVTAAELTHVDLMTDGAWLDAAFGSMSPGDAAIAAHTLSSSSEITGLDPSPTELAEMVRLIMSADQLSSWWSEVLAAHVPHPSPIDLIFHPPADLPVAEQTPERIVARALAYRAIQL